MNKPISILITTGLYPPEIGGPATYTKLMEKKLREQNIKVSVLPFRIVRFLPKVIRHFIFFLYIVFYSKGVDIIYAQDPVSVGFPSLVASKILRKKFIIRVAGDYSWEQSRQRFGGSDTIDEFQNKKYGRKIEFLRSIQKFTVKHADKVIVPSRYFLELVKGWIGDQKSKVEVVYNGVDFTEFPKIKTNTDYNPKTIISAGRLVPWKGFEMIMESLIDLPKWKFYIAGSGPDERRLRDLSKEKGLSDRVFFLGQLDRNELIKKIAQCEIFVLNTSFESFSFQIVESMRVGTPVIATFAGSIPEIIDNEKSGFLIKPNDKEKFLEYVNTLSSNKKIREDIINSGKEKTDDFSIEKTANNTIKIFKSLLSV